MNIVRSCEVANSLWTEVEGMQNSLDRLFKKAIEDREFSDYKSAGNPVKLHLKTDLGWMYQGTANSFPIMLKKKRKEDPSAWINYQINLFGSGVPKVDAAEQGELPYAPTLHISLWGCAIDTLSCIEFPFDFDNDVELMQDNRLFYWGNSDNELEFNQWTFSLRLLDMGTEETLRQSVIMPIKALMAGTEVKKALPDDLKGLIRYKTKELANGKKTCVVMIESETV